MDIVDGDIVVEVARRYEPPESDYFSLMFTTYDGSRYVAIQAVHRDYEMIFEPGNFLGGKLFESVGLASLWISELTEKEQDG